MSTSAFSNVDVEALATYVRFDQHSLIVDPSLGTNSSVAVVEFTGLPSTMGLSVAGLLRGR